MCGHRRVRAWSPQTRRVAAALLLDTPRRDHPPWRRVYRADGAGGDRKPLLYDGFAAACAEVGDFDRAVQILERLQTVLRERGLQPGQEIGLRLDCYRRSLPCRLATPIAPQQPRPR